MVKKFLISILKNKLPKLIPEHFDNYHIKSYSQEGEDMILKRIFEKTRNGFYVDIGAHHPMLYSNTYYFYKQGWSGINIDAMPGSMKEFNRIRDRDINIEAAIYKDISELTYFMFNEPALNTFDSNLAQKRISNAYHIVNKEIISTKTLKDILKKYVPTGKKINFMSVDVEGIELEVLQSNDWDLFRPEYLIVEYYCEKLMDIFDSEMNKYLSQRNYDLFGKTVLSLIYKDRMAS